MAEHECKATIGELATMAAILIEKDPERVNRVVTIITTHDGELHVVTNECAYHTVETMSTAVDAYYKEYSGDEHELDTE